PGDAHQGQRLDIAADEGTRLNGLLDEQAEGGAPRQRLQAQGAGAGEQIQHLGVGEGQAGDGVVQDVEEGLAHAVGGGPDAIAAWREERAAAEPAADDPHVAALRLRGAARCSRGASASSDSPRSWATRGPSWSRRTRRRTGSTSPAARSSSWNGPKEM